jgi:Asp-tRNA(Asn)/Glu-tRNA(Gln) amidotransferase A subunit family amidase
VIPETVVEIADAVRSGKASAVDVVGHALRAIERTNRDLNAFVHLDADDALAHASRIDEAVAAGRDPGPLAGVPVGIKDLEDCRGMPTRRGSLLFADAPAAAADSIHCARLRAAGAVPLGKTATAEFGMDAITSTRACGVTRNPWRLDRTPGGSSGGSACAVSAGMVPLATGSDAGGSIRSPAGLTGLVGLKPSHGRIPRDRESLFSTLGALTRTVSDTARYLDVVSGPSPRDRMSYVGGPRDYERAVETLDVRGLRCAWSADYGYAVMDDEVVEIAHRAARELVAAAELCPVERTLVLQNHRRDWLVVNVARAWHGLVAAGISAEQLQQLSPTPQGAFTVGSRVGIEEFMRAEQNLERLRDDVARLFEDVDVLLSPDAAVPAFAAEGPSPTRIGGRDATPSGVEPLHFVANSCWNPSITVPAGRTREGLPVGLMITARIARDDVALRLARVLEMARPWPACRIAP